MAPVAHEAGTRLSPRSPTVPGQVVPMKFLRAKLTLRPSRHTPDRIALSLVGFASTGAMRRLRKRICQAKLARDANDEDPPPVLGDAIVLRVQHIPGDTITSHTVSINLVHQELAIPAVCHPIYVLHHERFGAHNTQNAIEFLIEEVDWLVGVSAPALAISLTGVAPYQQVSFGELVVLPDVAFNDLGVSYVVAVSLTGKIPNVVGPDNLEARPLQGEVGSTTPTEQ